MSDTFWTNFVSVVGSVLGALFWPAVALVALVSFRKEIKDAIGRVVALTATGVQLADKNQPQPMSLTAPHHIPPTGNATVDRLQELGRAAVMRDAKNMMEARGINDAAAMLETAAAYLVRLTLNGIYFITFGSQLSLLLAMEVHGGTVDEPAARAIWRKAKKQWPEIHKDRTFEQWVGFLINASMIESHGSGWRFQKDGGALFLDYIRLSGLSLERAG